MLRYDEIRLGDVGMVTDNTLWIARGEFIPDYTDEETGDVWGSIPTTHPITTVGEGNYIINHEHQDFMQGTSKSTILVIHRMNEYNV